MSSVAIECRHRIAMPGIDCVARFRKFGEALIVRTEYIKMVSKSPQMFRLIPPSARERLSEYQILIGRFHERCPLVVRSVTSGTVFI